MCSAAHQSFLWLSLPHTRTHQSFCVVFLSYKHTYQEFHAKVNELMKGYGSITLHFWILGMAMQMSPHFWLIIKKTIHGVSVNVFCNNLCSLASLTLRCTRGHTSYVPNCNHCWCIACHLILVCPLVTMWMKATKFVRRCLKHRLSKQDAIWYTVLSGLSVHHFHDWWTMDQGYP